MVSYSSPLTFIMSIYQINIQTLSFSLSLFLCFSVWLENFFWKECVYILYTNIHARAYYLLIFRGSIIAFSDLTIIWKGSVALFHTHTLRTIHRTHTHTHTKKKVRSEITNPNSCNYSHADSSPSPCTLKTSEKEGIRKTIGTHIPLLTPSLFITFQHYSNTLLYIVTSFSKAWIIKLGVMNEMGFSLFFSILISVSPIPLFFFAFCMNLLCTTK